MLTSPSAIVAGSGAAAWYLHPEVAPWPPLDAVPILDLIELRNPGAYLLFSGHGGVDAFAHRICQCDPRAA